MTAPDSRWCQAWMLYTFLKTAAREGESGRTVRTLPTKKLRNTQALPAFPHTSAFPQRAKNKYL